MEKMEDIARPEFVDRVLGHILSHPVGYFSLLLYLAAELMFYLYIVMYLDPRIQEPLGQGDKPIQKTLFTSSARESLKEALLMLNRVRDHYSFESWCYLLFLRRDLKDVYTENMDSAFAWAMYTKELHQLSNVDKNAVVSLRKEALVMFGATLKEGFNPDIRHVRFNLEPVTYVHKPLISYMTLAIVDFYAHIHLGALGFTRYFLPDGTSYWHKPGSVVERHVDDRNDDVSCCPESSYLLKNNFKKPILLFHGICPGWGYYLKLISTFCDRAMILYENDSIKWNWITLNVPEPTAVCENIETILKIHDIDKISVVSHSWGTFLATWIVKSKPQLVSHITLIEPIAVNVELFETTYYILYQQICTMEDFCVNVFIRNDITISNNLRRHFAWYNCSLHLQDVPDHISVFVSIAKEDRLVHARAAEEFVKYEMRVRNSRTHMKAKTGAVAAISYIIWDGYSHGMTCDSYEAVHEIKRRMENIEFGIVSDCNDV